MPRHPRLVAAALVLLATACASAQGFELERIQRADVSVLPGGSGQPHPLTGVVSSTAQDWQTRPVLGIKIGNSGPERPQAGIDHADVVYEELVEGGVTRFLALFSTNQAERVGPVRSVRTVDPVLMAPTGGLFGYSGGVPPVIEALRSAPGVTDVGADRVGDAYRRDSSRRAPYNLYTSTSELFAAQGGSPPQPQFDFLSSSDDAATGGEETANEVRLSFADNSEDVRFAYDAQTGRYDRFVDDEPHMTTNGGDVHLAFRNVIIQQVDTSSGATVDTRGARSTEIDVVGEGPAVIFRGGVAIRGTWERSSEGERTRFIHGSGDPIRLAPGSTIVELLPTGRDVFVQ